MKKLQFDLTERQKNELNYHLKHAKDNADILDKPFSWDVLNNPARRWWNAYWQMYAFLAKNNLKGKRVLVVGCGFGDDALRIAKLNADVYAFDLSPESLSIAKSLANREGLTITFNEMPAESLTYSDNFFDLIVARDILHHVDIPKSITELRRVAKPGAIFIANEVYSHTFTDRIRYSVLVEKVLYPRMQRLVYGGSKPYITEDERKLNEHDIQEIMKQLTDIELKKYFNFLVMRILPDRFEVLSKIDRMLLVILKPIAQFFGGRILFAGHFIK